MAPRFFNTLGRRLTDFSPLEAGQVRMYTCGPTVYNVAHIGNLRTFVFEDVLRRYLLASGYRVTQIMNLTDVDDKTIRGAAQEGLPLPDFTQRYVDAFFRDLKRLAIDPAEKYPRATEHIPEMIMLIERLRERGHTYESEGSVWFRISTFPDYGKLSRIDLSQTRRGERVADDEYEKEDVRDFALWKAAKPGEPAWDSPFGPGRPGWHIECSAMSMKYLGEHFDIHTGAVDNIFPHHENEIAQSEGATGHPFVNTWLHAEHLVVDGEKMAKSKGNFYTLDDVLARERNPIVVRFLLLSVPYRKKLNFTWDGLSAVGSGLARLRSCDARLGELAAAGVDKGLSPLAQSWANTLRRDFNVAMDNDLNTAEALAAVFVVVQHANTAIDTGKIDSKGASLVRDALREVDRVLGLLPSQEPEVLPAEIEAKIEARNAARGRRDFAEADRIRAELSAQGIVLEDGPTGTRWKRA